MRLFAIGLTSFLAAGLALVTITTSSFASVLPRPQNLLSGISPDGTVIRELPELRSEDSDTFLLSDGSRVVKVYSHPVNYARAGGWQPIEDQLVQDADGSHPKSSPVPVTFPAALGAAPIVIGSGSGELTLSLQGASVNKGSVAGNRATYSKAMPNVEETYATGP
jgi:hypothetical protein